MRAADTFNESLFSMRGSVYFVPENHPLHPVRKIVNAALKKIEPLLSRMCAAEIKGRRPSIAPPKTAARRADKNLLQNPLRGPADGANPAQLTRGCGARWVVPMMRLSIEVGRRLRCLCSAISGDCKELFCVN